MAGGDWEDVGAEKGRQYFLGFRVWPMGDLNSCDVAQVAHEGILQEAGLAQEDSMVRYSKPLPQSRLQEFVFIDDRHVILRASRALVERGLPGPDQVAIQQGSEAYARARVPEAEEDLWAR